MTKTLILCQELKESLQRIRGEQYLQGLQASPKQDSGEG